MVPTTAQYRDHEVESGVIHSSEIAPFDAAAVPATITLVITMGAVKQATALARDQDGVLTRAQALAAGLSENAIRWNIDRGRWRQLHSGLADLPEGGYGDLIRSGVAELRDRLDGDVS